MTEETPSPDRPGRRRNDVGSVPAQPAPDPLVEEDAAPRPHRASEKPTLYARWQTRRAALSARRSSVRVTRVSPWGALITSLFCSVALACAVEGLVYLTWRLFDSAGIFDKIVETLVPTGGDGADKLQSWLTLEKFLTVGGVLACSLLVIVPVFCFFAAVTFNLVAKLTGGVRITLTGSK